MTCIGQDGHDIVGPDASQGPDGIQDLHMQLANFSGAVSSISIQAPGGFEWATEPDPTGAALAEYFASSTPGQGDLYINPQVKSDLPPPGGTLPLGGSTGSLIQLANGTPLTVTINYQGQSTADVVTVPVSGMVSATDPMPATPIPSNVSGTFQVTDDGQDGTGQSYEQGFVHLVVTAPAGVTFDGATFGQIIWGLNDSSSYEWDSTGFHGGAQPHLRHAAIRLARPSRTCTSRRWATRPRRAARPRPRCCCKSRCPEPARCTPRRSPARP